MHAAGKKLFCLNWPQVDQKEVFLPNFPCLSGELNFNSYDNLIVSW